MTEGLPSFSIVVGCAPIKLVADGFASSMSTLSAAKSDAVLVYVLAAKAFLSPAERIFSYSSPRSCLIFISFPGLEIFVRVVPSLRENS